MVIKAATKREKIRKENRLFVNEKRQWPLFCKKMMGAAVSQFLLEQRGDNYSKLLIPEISDEKYCKTYAG